jgi:hypothetical protein
MVSRGRDKKMGFLIPVVVIGVLSLIGEANKSNARSIVSEADLRAERKRRAVRRAQTAMNNSRRCYQNARSRAEDTCSRFDRLMDD